MSKVTTLRGSRVTTQSIKEEKLNSSIQGALLSAPLFLVALVPFFLRAPAPFFCEVNIKQEKAKKDEGKKLDLTSQFSSEFFFSVET